MASIFIAFSACGAFAQAADKDAIDLSGKMDTIAMGSADLFHGLFGFLNVGLQNTDNWEDFEIKGDITRMRFGGDLIFDTANNPEFGDNNPNLCGDFDGDGINDILSHNGILFFKGKKTFPYYDFYPTSQAVSHYLGEYFFLPKSVDFDEDGTKDLLVCTGDHNIRFYKGGSTFGKTKYMFATDSIQLPAAFTAMEVAKFNPTTKPIIVCYCADKKLYLLKQIGNSFSQDSVILISDSASGGIAVTNLYATDFTGDGIKDLLVSDGLHIYIFKGGSDFGTYPLIPKNAFYTITTPLIKDIDNWSFLNTNFGNYMFACGDLTGSGSPYLAVGASTNPQTLTRGYIFFYAGGKALDTLYDAVIGYYNIGEEILDTLHSVNSTGRTVCLVNDGSDMQSNLRDLDLLMSRDCDKIPHKTNPRMLTATNRIMDQSLEINAFPSIANKFEKVQIISKEFSIGTITVYDLLGRKIANHQIDFDAGDNTEYFNTTDWNSGTYIVKVESKSEIQSAKFFVSH